MNKPEKIEEIRRACIESNQDSEFVIWACEGCNSVYAEYVNGCVHCWDHALSREENLKKYPKRGVKSHFRNIHLDDILLMLCNKDHPPLFVGVTGCFYTANNQGTLGANVATWNLKREFKDQSDRLIDFIHELIQK